jgi:hypothetical protein
MGFIKLFLSLDLANFNLSQLFLGSLTPLKVKVGPYLWSAWPISLVSGSEPRENSKREWV